MVPNNESGINKRRYPRVKARVLYTQPRFYGPPRLLGQKREISDISPGGARIYSDEPLKESKAVQLELELPSGRSITATARIVWIEELPPGSEAKFDVGLEFLVMPNEAYDELQALLEELPHVE
ncbi:MAG: PilZ domain-containing protein [Candidatus Aminicenantes bacterium]|nr:MAG: PilZ domain-containing protein [Candidatus Aminicenantes bacterium]